MEKTISITIGGVIFYIEEDAYEKLEKYLNTVRGHFSSSGDPEEIIEDIETSIAEKFSAKQGKKNRVITERDIDELIKTMGTVEDFKNFSDEGNVSSKEEERKSNSSNNGDYKIKKLYRNPDDKIIAGVASGIAAYFGIDPVIVRLIFVGSVFLGGTGIFAYLILWIAMPIAKSHSQKLEMQGRPVTLEKLEEVIKKKAKKIDTKSISGKINIFFKKLFSFFEIILKNIGKIVWPGIAIIIGISIVVSMIFSILGVSFAAGILTFNIDSPYINSEIPLDSLTSNGQYYLAVISTYLIILIPFIFILLIGIFLIKRKNVFNAILNGSLVGIWMIAIIVLGLSLIDMGPEIEKKVKEFEEFDSVSSIKEYDYENFNSIIISNSYKVNLVKGDEFKISAKGREKDLEKLILSENNNSLNIKEKEDEFKICIFCYDRRVELNITAPDISSLKTSDSSRISVTGYENKEFEIIMNDYSRSDIDITTDKLLVTTNDGARANITSSSTESVVINANDYSRVTLIGKTNDLKLNLERSSRFYGFNFPSKIVNLMANGYSDAEINATEKLIIEAGESNDISYMGNPEIITSKKYLKDEQVKHEYKIDNNIDNEENHSTVIKKINGDEIILDISK